MIQVKKFIVFVTVSAVMLLASAIAVMACPACAPNAEQTWFEQALPIIVFSVIGLVAVAWGVWTLIKRRK